MERKLAAILSADVQGYSRLMGDDEAATIRTLTTYREVMTALIQQHHGRVVDAPGDNLLAEFASAVDAVQSAVAIQKELKTCNAELPTTRQMHYRIGINVGDVVVEGERIYGDGVIHDQTPFRLALYRDSMRCLSISVCFDSAAIAATLSTSGNRPLPLSPSPSSGQATRSEVEGLANG